jgi:hypothetical protein
VNPQQYPTPPVPPQPPKRKRRVWPWLLAAAIVIIVIAAASGGGKHDSTTGQPVTHNAASPAPATTVPPLTAQAPSGHGKTILYEVISDSPTLNNVTYFDEHSAEQQDINTTAPWSKTVVNSSTYAIAGIAAQTNGQSVTCRITIDGKVADTKTSTGQYAVVNCNAAVR